MESVGDVENIKVEKKESRIWKAAKVGILALGLMAFGKNLKAEEPMKTTFVKEHYENGTVIEYEHIINDKESSQIIKNYYYNINKDFINKEYNISIYSKNRIGIGRLYSHIEINRNKNVEETEYNDSSLYGDYANYKKEKDDKKTDIFLGVGTSIAPNGIEEKVRLGVGYYSREIQVNEEMNYNSLLKNIVANLGSGLVIYGDMINNEISNRKDVGYYEGYKAYLQYILNKNITSIAWFISATGNIDHSFDNIDQYNINGIICNSGNCSPGSYRITFEDHVLEKIKTKMTEFGIRIPITIRNNLIMGEWNKRITVYNDTGPTFNNSLEKEVINTISLYYKKQVIKNIAISIGYTHTLEKIIRTYKEEKNQDSKIIAGTQIKF